LNLKIKKKFGMVEINKNIESFWIQAEEILVSNLDPNEKSTKLYSLINENLDRTQLSKYDKNYKLIEVQNYENLASVEKGDEDVSLKKTIDRLQKIYPEMEDDIKASKKMILAKLDSELFRRREEKFPGYILTKVKEEVQWVIEKYQSKEKAEQNNVTSATIDTGGAATEQFIKNMANLQKDQIIKRIWNPLFNEAKTLNDYSCLLNFVMPVNKRYPFCSDYELTDKIYSIISDIIDENTSFQGIIDFLRPEEFYDISERDSGTYSKLLDILSKNMLKQASIQELVYYIDPGDEYLNIIMQFDEDDILKYLKKVKSEIHKSDLEEILERLEDYGFEFIEEFRD
jgi:hypothetical protein